MSLIDCLSSVSDPRRLQGQRYSSIPILLIIIMAILRGRYGYRETGRFCGLKESVLIDKFGFKNKKVPPHVSLRTFILATDFPLCSHSAGLY
ncbi:MAG: transposase family protein [Prevotella sp.]|nr:transposase family protein [Prevotella sp.]